MKLRRLFTREDSKMAPYTMENITLKGLQDCFQTEEAAKVFASMDINVEDAWDLFKLIDIDDSSTVCIGEFITGCLRLKGGAKAIDVARLTYEHGHLVKKL